MASFFERIAGRPSSVKGFENLSKSAVHLLSYLTTGKVYAQIVARGGEIDIELVAEAQEMNPGAVRSLLSAIAHHGTHGIQDIA